MTRESALHKILSIDKEKTLAVSKIQIEALMMEVRHNTELELLNWFIVMISKCDNLMEAKEKARARMAEIRDILLL